MAIKSVSSGVSYDTIFSRAILMGAHTAIQKTPKGQPIPNFSPNNLRRVILAHDGIAVQTFVASAGKNKTQVTRIEVSDATFNQRSSFMLRRLLGEGGGDARIYSSVEEVIVLAVSPNFDFPFTQHGVDAFVQKAQAASGFKRLRAVSLVQSPITLDDFLAGFQDQMHDPAFLFASKVEEAGIGTVVWLNDESYLRHTSLRPQYYGLDAQGTPLYNYFQKTKELASQSPSSVGVSIDPSDRTAKLRRLYRSVLAPARGLYKALYTTTVGAGLASTRGEPSPASVASPLLQAGIVGIFHDAIGLSSLGIAGRSTFDGDQSLLVYDDDNASYHIRRDLLAVSKNLNVHTLSRVPQLRFLKADATDFPSRDDLVVLSELGSGTLFPLYAHLATKCESLGKSQDFLILLKALKDAQSSSSGYVWEDALPDPETISRLVSDAVADYFAALSASVRAEVANTAEVLDTDVDVPEVDADALVGEVNTRRVLDTLLDVLNAYSSRFSRSILVPAPDGVSSDSVDLGAVLSRAVDAGIEQSFLSTVWTVGSFDPFLGLEGSGAALELYRSANGRPGIVSRGIVDGNPIFKAFCDVVYEASEGRSGVSTVSEHLGSIARWLEGFGGTLLSDFARALRAVSNGGVPHTAEFDGVLESFGAYLDGLLDAFSSQFEGVFQAVSGDAVALSDLLASVLSFGREFAEVLGDGGIEAPQVLLSADFQDKVGKVLTPFQSAFGISDHYPLVSDRKMAMFEVTDGRLAVGAAYRARHLSEARLSLIDTLEGTDWSQVPARDRRTILNDKVSPFLYGLLGLAIQSLVDTPALDCLRDGISTALERGSMPDVSFGWPSLEELEEDKVALRDAALAELSSRVSNLGVSSSGINRAVYLNILDGMAQAHREYLQNLPVVSVPINDNVDLEGTYAALEQKLPGSSLIWALSTPVREPKLDLVAVDGSESSNAYVYTQVQGDTLTLGVSGATLSSSIFWVGFDEALDYARSGGDIDGSSALEFLPFFAVTSVASDSSDYQLFNDLYYLSAVRLDMGEAVEFDHAPEDVISAYRSLLATLRDDVRDGLHGGIVTREGSAVARSLPVYDFARGALRLYRSYLYRRILLRSDLVAGAIDWDATIANPRWSELDGALFVPGGIDIPLVAPEEALSSGQGVFIAQEPKNDRPRFLAGRVLSDADTYKPALRFLNALISKSNSVADPLALEGSDTFVSTVVPFMSWLVERGSGALHSMPSQLHRFVSILWDGLDVATGTLSVEASKELSSTISVSEAIELFETWLEGYCVRLLANYADIFVEVGTGDGAVVLEEVVSSLITADCGEWGIDIDLNAETDVSQSVLSSLPPGIDPAGFIATNFGSVPALVEFLQAYNAMVRVPVAGLARLFLEQFDDGQLPSDLYSGDVSTVTAGLTPYRPQIQELLATFLLVRFFEVYSESRVPQFPVVGVSNERIKPITLFPKSRAVPEAQLTPSLASAYQNFVSVFSGIEGQVPYIAYFRGEEGLLVWVLDQMRDVIGDFGIWPSYLDRRHGTAYARLFEPSTFATFKPELEFMSPAEYDAVLKSVDDWLFDLFSYKSEGNGRTSKALSSMFDAATARVWND